MRIEDSLLLPVPPAELWPWLVEPERLVRWIPESTRFQASVERSEEPRERVLRAVGLPNDLEARLSFRLEPEGTGTRLALSAEAELTGMMIFAEKLIAAKAREKLAGWAQKLREQLAAG